MDNFNAWPTLLQFVTSLLLALMLGIVVVAVIIIISTPNLSSYLATTSLWLATIAVWLAARNNGGVRKYSLMLFSLALLASINTLGSLRRLGLEDISPILLTRMISATFVFIGFAIVYVFGLRYVKSKRLKRRGLKEHITSIYYPADSSPKFFDIIVNGNS